MGCVRSNGAVGQLPQSERGHRLAAIIAALDIAITGI
jgi:hypothetical protein